MSEWKEQLAKAYNKQKLEPKEEDHECEFSGDVDCDICRDCGEHTGFCDDCGLSGCCGATPYSFD